MNNRKKIALNAIILSYLLVGMFMAVSALSGVIVTDLAGGQQYPEWIVWHIVFVFGIWSWSFRWLLFYSGKLYNKGNVDANTIPEMNFICKRK